MKRVPDSSSEVLLTEDAQAVDGSKAGFTTSPHEECAVEIATQLAADGGEATVLTLGDKDAVEQLRTALAVGCHQATHVVADAHTLGPADVAREIAGRGQGPRGGRTHARPRAARQRRRRQRRLPGRHPARLRARPPGRQRRHDGHRRGRPDGRVAVAVGKGPEGQETYRVPLPAVVTIREGGVEPRYPSVKGRMQAKKVQIEERTPAAEPRGPQRVKLLLPPPTPSSVQILGEGAEAAPAVVDLFEQLGVLSR